MSKLGYRMILPIAHVSLAVLLLGLGRQVHQPTQIGFPYSPTPTLVCKGISAPAALFSIAVGAVAPFERLDHPPISFSGFAIDDVLFLFGVVILWYLVGLAIDRHRAQRQRERAHNALRIFIDLLLIGLAMVLLLVSFTPILAPKGLTNPTGARIAAILWLTWSLLLFLVPGINLTRMFRSRDSAA